MRTMRQSVFLELLACVAFIIAIPTTASAQTAASTRRILVLHSYSRHLPWDIGVVKGIGEIMDSIEPGDRPLLFEENLDSNLVGEIAATAAFGSYLSAKYGHVALDAVITESQQAAALLLEFPELFPGAQRYIFNYAPAASLGAGNGSERRYSTASDLETALRTIPMLVPSVRRIIVVADRSSIGLARSEQIRGMTPTFADTPPEIWDDFTEPELLDRARGLPRDVAILYLPVTRDRQGATLVPATVVTNLARAAPVPVFSHFDSLLGTGIVGGYLVRDWKEHNV